MILAACAVVTGVGIALFVIATAGPIEDWWRYRR